MAKKMTMAKAIRAKCLDCTGGQPKEVNECLIDTCSLWPYRMGRKPRINTEEETALLRGEFSCWNKDDGLNNGCLQTLKERDSSE